MTFYGFSRKFCGFLRFSTLFSKVFSRVFSKVFLLYALRTCKLFLLFSSAVLAFCKCAGGGFWAPRFSKKNAIPFAVLSSAYFAPTLFSSAVLAFCMCAGGGFWVPRFSKKMLTRLLCTLLPTLRRPRPAPPLGTRTWFSHAYSSAARFRQDTRAQTTCLTPDFAVAVLWLADTQGPCFHHLPCSLLPTLVMQ